MVKRLPWSQTLSSSMVRHIFCVGTAILLSISSGTVAAIATMTTTISSSSVKNYSESTSEVNQLAPGFRRTLENVIALVDTVLAERDRPLLQFGSEGETVQAVQVLLQLMGYYSGQIDGRYQESTTSAVSSFQRAAGLSADGIIGPTTWEKLLPQPDDLAEMDLTSTSDISSLSSSNSVASDNTEANNEANSDENSVDGRDRSSGPSGIDVLPVSHNSADENIDSSSSEVINRETTAHSGDVDSVSIGRESETVASNQPNSASSDTITNSSFPSSNEVTLPTLRRGMRGPAVINLQERLRSLGLLEGIADGVFGEQTEDAVKTAQQSFSLTPDGVVGPATWAALLQ